MILRRLKELRKANKITQDYLLGRDCTKECEFIESQEKKYSDDCDDFRYYIHTKFTCSNCSFVIEDNEYCNTCRILNYCQNCGFKVKEEHK
ncbi:MAG: hypothetical protein FWE22_08625 [Firmicutes bacterium]|nr:hypothetical protein [Bacillota bacterium]